MRKLFPIVLFICLAVLSHGQVADDRCASDQLHRQLLDRDPDYRQSFDALQEFTRDFVQKQQASDHTWNRRAVVTVPVVVHILHTGQPVGTGANISEAQVMSAVTALNEDFRRADGTNGDGDGVDMELEFCLAQKDFEGNETSGILRVDATGVCQGGSCYETDGININANESAVKNASPAWPNSSYYNIWIVTEINGNNGGSGIQGYAYFPGAPGNLDGAVILYNQFGTVGNLKAGHFHNRVTTHEVGHGFNLFHSFQGDNGGGACPVNSNCAADGDRVCDTPPHIRSASGTCDIFGTNACDGNSPNELYVHNYMNYSDGLCMNMFTQGQKDRVDACLAGPRSALLFSDGCEPPCDGIEASFIPNQTVFEIGGSLPNPTVYLTNTSTGNPDYNWLIDGTSFSTMFDAEYIFTMEGIYNICLEAIDTDGCVETFCRQFTVNGPGECVNPPDLFINGDFETPVDIVSNSVASINNNLLGWNVSHGTPSTAANATANGRNMWLWSYCTSGCPNFDVVHGEGIFNCFQFEVGKEYQVCFDIRTNGRPSATVEFRAARGLNVSTSNALGGDINVTDLATQSIYNEDFSNLHPATGSNSIGSNDYIHITTTFVADDDYTSLWVFPFLPFRPNDGGVQSGQNYQGSMQVDNIEVHLLDLSRYGISPDVTICDDMSAQLEASGGINYEWTSVGGDPVTTLSCTDCPDPVASPDNTTTYEVAISDTNICDPVIRQVTVFIDCDAVCTPDPDFTVADLGCNTFQFFGTENGVNTVNAFSWDFGDPVSGNNNISSLQDPIHTFTTAGVYSVCLSTGCDNFNSATACMDVTVNDDLQAIAMDYVIDDECDDQDCGMEIEFNTNNVATPPLVITYTNINTGATAMGPGPVITDLCRGSYFITVTDAGCNYADFDLELICSLCSATNIDVNLVELQAVTCPGTCDGEIEFSLDPATMAAPPFSYTVSDSNGTMVASGSGYQASDPAIVVTSLCSGMYNVEFEDASGCISVSDITLMPPAGSSAVLGPLPDVCVDVAPFNLMQGSPPGGTYIGPGVLTSPLFDPQVAGPGQHTIQYVYTSGTGCSDTAARLIEVTTVDSDTIMAEICEGEFYSLGINDSTSMAGTYIDTFSGTNGCHVVQYIILGVVAVEEDTVMDVVCPGDSYTLADGTVVAGPGEYTISETGTSGCEVITTYVLSGDENCTEPCEGLKAPNVFSPNADGLNDVFHILNTCPVDPELFELQIYSRWGELVFQSDDLAAGWDGTFKGEPVPIDAFVYTVDFQFPQSDRGFMKGNVIVLR